nr:S1 RNA-binding domain-containing protein [Sphingomonas sp.]
MASAATPTRDDFAKLLEQTLGDADGFEGRVVHGTVTGIENDMAIIDVGLKSEGRVPLREFAAPGQKADLKVGDEVEVYVDRVENVHGEAMLSRDRARREAAWDKLEAEFTQSARVDGVIFGRVKGGFTVDLDGAVAFLPGSQVDIRPVRDVQPLMDIPQPFQILKMDRKRGNIVVSRRAVLEETRAEQRSGLIQSLHEGQIIDGVVNVGSPEHRRHRQGPDHPHQQGHAAHLARHEAARERSVGRRRRQVSCRREDVGPRDQHHRIRCVRRARAGYRRPGSRFRDELDQEERAPGQDRLDLAGSRCRRARGRRGQAPH